MIEETKKVSEAAQIDKELTQAAIQSSLKEAVRPVTIRG